MSDRLALALRVLVVVVLVAVTTALTAAAVVGVLLLWQAVRLLTFLLELWAAAPI